jgi:hypothetical protein
MYGERTRRHIVKLHFVLKPHGYVLDGSDIEYSCPLGNQARGNSKMPIVVTYKDSETAHNISLAARAAGLWNRRKSREDDKIKDRKGYFKAAIPRRDTKSNLSRKPHTESCGGDRPKKNPNTKRSQSRDKKLPSQADPQPEEPNEGENPIKNWQVEHDSPKYKPPLNLRKVDRNDPYLRNQLEKLKADREKRERKTDKECRSAASSVEFVDKVIHITGQQ